MKKSYKYLWEKLKSNITDQEILALMNSYEHEKPVTSKKQGQIYDIVLSKQSWYETYWSLQHLFSRKIKQKLLLQKDYDTFKRDFSDLLKLVISGEKTNADMTDWLNSVYKKVRNTRPTTFLRKKTRLTSSGFERKTRSKLSLDERAEIVIDDLVDRFKPKLPKEYDNIDISYYEEDWKQELWSWCWEHREIDPNLHKLILKFNALSKIEYTYAMGNLFSRVNRYILSYIVKLHYSCNDIARYCLNGKYADEELYPADDLEKVDKMDFELTEKENYVKEDVEIFDSYDKNLIQSVFDQLDAQGLVRYRVVLELRYGFNEENRIYTLQEIGNKFGVTRERIRQMEESTLEKVREILKRR